MAVKKRKVGRKAAKNTKPKHVPKKNPAKFPKGKFVKVQAVRVNRDGTITVKK